MANYPFGSQIGCVRVDGVNLDVYSNEACDHTSESKTYDADGFSMGLRYQSVELVRRYLYAKIGFNVALFWSDGDAIDWWKAHRFMGLTQIDVDKLQPGDILVWRGGKFGHQISAGYP